MLLHKGIIHVATNRALVEGRTPDPTKTFPTSPKLDFFGHEPELGILNFARFAGTVPTGRQLTELELHLCRYDWFAKNVLGLEPPRVWQPEILADADDYEKSLTQHMQSNNSKYLANFWHGFDTTTLNGYQHALALSEGLHKLKIAVSHTSWPSHGKPFVPAYMADTANSNASVPASELHLEHNIRAAGGADKVIAVTHSLGAPLLLQTLANRYYKSGGKPEKLYAIFLVSPDIDRKEFLNLYADVAIASARHVWVLVSDRDVPLRMSEAFRELGVDNQHDRLGQAKNPPVIPGITFVDDTENDHGILGHMLRFKTIARLLEQQTDVNFINTGVLDNPALSDQLRTGPSPHYVLKRNCLW